MKTTPKATAFICSLLMLLTLQSPRVNASDDERPSIPDISYPDLAGISQNLQQWKGKLLLLNFWASWCAPCLTEIRYLNEYQREFGPSGLQIVGLGLDDPLKLKNVQRTLSIRYPILVVDEIERNSILNAWGNKSGLIPFTVIFDKRGHVVRAHKGIIDDSQFSTSIRPLLDPTRK